MSVRPFVGTSGYNFEAWKGTFYPARLPPEDWLAFYATHLPSVEINYTFYRTPSESTVKAWAHKVPDTFRLTLKASQRITHKGRLTDKDSTDYFTGKLSGLGDRAGALLVQLPPFVRKDVEKLQAFLSWLPPGVRPALEFRHKSWFDPEVENVLRTARAALCISDDGELECPVWSTASYGYLRLRRDTYDDAMLKDWADRIRAQNWEDVFCYFKHEDAAQGVGYSKAMLGLLGA
jgi:uncharacterized protein YecE (DUF72 family)